MMILNHDDFLPTVHPFAWSFKLDLSFLYVLIFSQPSIHLPDKLNND